MKLKLPEIDPYRFYQVGKYAFFTVALIGMIRVVDVWSSLKSYEIFSSLAMTIFYFVLCGFFAKLQKDSEIKEVNDGDIIKMNEALEQLNLGGKKDDEKKGN